MKKNMKKRESIRNEYIKKPQYIKRADMHGRELGQISARVLKASGHSDCIKPLVDDGDPLEEKGSLPWVSRQYGHAVSQFFEEVHTCSIARTQEFDGYRYEVVCSG